MAAGGGLYLTAVFATGMILVALALLGRLERKFSLKSMLLTYEVTGANAEGLLVELTGCLTRCIARCRNVRVAGTTGNVRVLFSVDGPREDQDEINILLHQSTTFSA